VTDRWWAPEGPAIGISVSDLVLLEPGTDAAYDLGAAVFAMHRVGAAACELVAQSPLPSVTSLVETLALARSSYAQPVVESIAKCLGEPVYAGLLVRDLADDAERGAAELFSAAVSKGVAAPLAAQRAGMVYGVPSARMGTFRALACVPASSPTALQDAADRVLFSYIEGVTQNEMTGQEIAKAEQVKVAEKEPWKDEVRSASGRWAKTGGVDLQALMNPTTPAAEEVKTPERVVRLKRVQRVQRKKAVEEAPAERVRERVRTPAQRATEVRRSSQRERIRLKTKAPTRAEVRSAKVPTFHPPAAPAETDEYPEIDQQIPHNAVASLFLSRASMKNLDRLTEQNHERFTLDFEDGYTYAEVTHLGKLLDASRANGAASLVQNDLKETPQVTQFFVPDGGEGQDHAMAARHVAAMVPTDPVALGLIAKDVDEFHDRANAGTHYVFAEHYVTINELRISGPGARGYVEGGRGDLSIRMDPNQEYRFVPNDDDDVTWDPQARAKVMVHTIAPVVRDYKGGDSPFDEDVWKADVTFLEQHREKRDVHGQFASLGSAELQRMIDQAMAAKPERVVRLKRTERARRAKPVEAPAVAVERPKARAHQPAKGRRITPAERVRMRHLAPKPVLEEGNYQVMNGNSFKHLLSQNPRHDDNEYPSLIHISDHATQAGLQGLGGYEPHEAVDAIAKDHSEHVHDVQAYDAGAFQYLTDTQELDIPHGLDLGKEVNRIVNGLFNMHPSITDLEVRLTPTESETLVEVRGLENPEPPLIVRHDVKNWDGPIVLRKLDRTEDSAFYDFKSPVEGEQDAETAHYIRGGHLVYALENWTPGQKAT
jgi:hypothetical protein